LARAADRHLTQDELEALVSSGAAQKWESLPLGDDSREVFSHMAHCEECRLLAASYAAVEARLVSLRSGGVVLRRADCPAEEEWRSMAGGLLSAEQTEKYMQHAANCDHCGPLLRRATEDFASELTSDEESLLNGLKSTDVDWQRGLAGRLSNMQQHRGPKANDAVPWWKTLSLWPRLVVSATSILLVVFAAFWFVKPTPEKIAERLLSAAYTQQRTMELRIPGARYSPMRLERRSGSSPMNRPSTLLEAEALIARMIPEHPNDPNLLKMRARADLLEGNYDSSIETLRRAIEIEPHSPALLADLAAAFFERGEAQDRPSDYGSAVDGFGKVLAITPEDPVVLFNRAIASERIFLYAQAIEDWQHYLRIDPSGKWADEARQRLESLQNKLKKHDEGTLTPLKKPSEIAVHHNDSVLRDALNSRIEEYLRVATRDWLPEAFPTGGSNLNETDVQNNKESLRFLAEISKTDHSDGWLRDLLLRSQSLQFPHAVSSMSSALNSIDRGDFVAAERDAREASKLFQAGNNNAGSLRARTEQIYALHLSQQGVVCSKLAASVSAELSRHDYSWLRGQVGIERAICLSITGKLDTAKKSYERALQTAEQSGYGALYLRALLGISDLDSVTGNAASAWFLDLRGLSLFWNGNYPAMRGYSIYTDLDTLAASSHLWNLQVAAVQQAIRTLGPDKNELLRAMIHSRLASAAILAGKFDLARDESIEANRLFNSSPQTEAARNNQIETEIWSARLDLDRGHDRSAIQRLTAWQDEVSRLSNSYTAINFYQTLGSAQAHLGESNEAEASLRAAITLAEQSLSSLRSERDRRLWSHETGDSYRSLAESRFRQNDIMGALELWEWYRGASLGRKASLGKKPDSVRLPPDLLNRVARETGNLARETILSYLVLSDGLIVWESDDRGINAKWVATRRLSLEDLSGRYSAMCADPNSSTVALDRDARALYNLLIEPIAEYLDPGRTLIIEPDEPLYSIPFQSLRDAQGRYVVEKFALVWSPGLYFTEVSQSAPPLDAARRVLVVGAPAIAMGNVNALVPLPDASAEAGTIAEKFKNVHLVRGAQASLSLIKRELPKSEIFHFAGHAVSSADRVGLIVAANEADRSTQGFLDAIQIEQLPLLNTQLAVFSACSTEKTLDGSFDDPQSLVHAFLRAGVRRVIASRWNVDSTSTATLMNEFYDRLLTGASSSQALRLATLKVRDSGEHSHPYYWAAFSLFGES